MMGRVLANHPDIFTFKELHFFGTIWTNKNIRKLTKDEQIHLMSRLLCIQERGLFSQDNYSDFMDDAQKIIADSSNSALEVYRLFLENTSSRNNCSVSCEQTPKNLYYLEEILQFFPNAKVINMVRDQRDVLLSQKNKWKRKFLGANTIPFTEAFRSFINYHPILTSKVWNSCIQKSNGFVENDRVMIVKFEELLQNPEQNIKEICNFINVEFDANMLKVPVVGSSTEEDVKGNLLIDSSKIAKWKKGGLNNAEIYLSQLIAGKMMRQSNYALKRFSFPPILVLFYLITFPVKLVLAFLLNIKRMGNIVEVIRKRFYIK